MEVKLTNREDREAAKLLVKCLNAALSERVFVDTLAGEYIESKLIEDHIKLPNLKEDPVQYFSAKMIADYLFEVTKIKSSPVLLGRQLTLLGFQSKMKRINGSEPKKVYLICKKK